MFTSHSPRFFVVLAFFLAVASLHAGEDLMPLSPGSGGASGQKNMVKITLPSLAARARPTEIALDSGWTSVPELPAGQEYQASPADSWRYHIPGEMRFPVEPALESAAMPGSGPGIASNLGFDNLLNDLVSLDSAPPAPVTPVAAEAVSALAPAGGGGMYPARVSIPSLPMPSQTYRSEQASQAGYAGYTDYSGYAAVPVSAPVPIAVPEVRTPDLPPVAGPSPISISDFSASSGRVGFRPAQVHPAVRSSRPAPDTRPVPEDFAPMRSLRKAIKTRR